MAWHKEHTVTCTICGTTFQALGNRAKYCRKCVIEQRRLAAKKYSKKCKADSSEEQETRYYRCSDNQAQRQACFHCTRPDCTKGECPLVKSLGKKTAKSEELYQSNKERVMQMFHQNMTAQEISKQVGIGPQTVNKWIDRAIWEERHREIS